MKKIDIDSFLRENKPQVKDSPTFMLEVQQKIRAVDGIKSEVDRQRRYGRQVLALSLFAGFVLGGIVAALAYLYPIDLDSIGDNLFVHIMSMIEPWKHYIILFVAGCAISLGVIYSTRDEVL